MDPFEGLLSAVLGVGSLDEVTPLSQLQGDDSIRREQAIISVLQALGQTREQRAAREREEQLFQLQLEDRELERRLLEEDRAFQLEDRSFQAQDRDLGRQMGFLDLLPEDQRGAALESILSQDQFGGIIPAEVADSFFTPERRLNPRSLGEAAVSAGLVGDTEALNRVFGDDVDFLPGLTRQAVDDVVGTGDKALAFDAIEDELIGMILEDELSPGEIRLEMSRRERELADILHPNAVPLLLAMYEDDLDSSTVERSSGSRLRSTAETSSGSRLR
jgi:hypothetical protein